MNIMWKDDDTELAPREPRTRRAPRPGLRSAGRDLLRMGWAAVAGNDAQPVTVWLSTEPDIDGTYRPTLKWGADHAEFLDLAACRLYCEYVLMQVCRAEFDAKVFRQLRKTLDGAPQQEQETLIAQVIQDLRADRAEPTSPTGLSLRPGVGQRGEPFLHVLLRGEPAGTWELPEAREHAAAAMEAAHIAGMDAAYLRVLKGAIGVDDETARNIVDALSRRG